MEREGRDGLFVTHSRFVINVIVFSLISNFYIISILSSTVLQHSIFKASEGILSSDVQNKVMMIQQSDDDNSVAGGENKILLSRVEAGYTNINKTVV